MKLYEEIAQLINYKIEKGYFQPGDKLPSIRQMSSEHQVSISTVQEAYRLLETKQVAEARPKSGYYVLAPQRSPAMPSISRPSKEPLEVSQWDLILKMLYNHEQDNDIVLGRGTPDVGMSTLKPLSKITANISTHREITNFTYDSLQGSKRLRDQISRLMIDSGCNLHPDEILVTTGCQEALSCSMRSVADAGDIVAIDSPSFYGSMQTIQAIGLKALEIPTHPETGISLEALELAAEQWPIKAVQLTPSCNNPLGYTMPNEHKARLIVLANRYNIAIIEDDIYGDLSYTQPRSRSIKSYDTEGRVIYCSSFSKTISPAYRTGWCAPGRYMQRVKQMKYVSTACGSVLQPRAIADFIAQGHYERHLRKARAQYLKSRDTMIDWVKKYFPEGTKMSYPQGGFLLWVELPESIQSIELNEKLAGENISIAPGVLFTASEKYQHCLRLNYSQAPNDDIRGAVEKIGNIAKTLLQKID